MFEYVWGLLLTLRKVVSQGMKRKKVINFFMSTHQTHSEADYDLHHGIIIKTERKLHHNTK